MIASWVGWVVRGAAWSVGLAATSCGAYWENRANDLIDPLSASVSLRTIGANVRVTQFLQAGAVLPLIAHSGSTGFAGRYSFEEADAGGAEVGIAPFFHSRRFVSEYRTIVLGLTRISSPAGRGPLSPWMGYEFEETFLPAPERYDRAYDRRLLDVGVSAGALIVLEVAIHPYEILDLILGFFTLDIAGDDRRAEEAERPGEEPGATEAPQAAPGIPDGVQAPRPARVAPEPVGKPPDPSFGGPASPGGREARRSEIEELSG